jgi:hypothetical protein
VLTHGAEDTRARLRGAGAPLAWRLARALVLTAGVRELCGSGCGFGDFAARGADRSRMPAPQAPRAEGLRHPLLALSSPPPQRVAGRGTCPQAPNRVDADVLPLSAYCRGIF